MINVDIVTKKMSGIVKNGEEVMEVIEKENIVDLIIVNLKFHSMRLLRGSGKEELRDIYLNESQENDIIDLNVIGERWEGEVKENKPFGYGCLYDDNNELIFEGWMINKVWICYGKEYWNDIGVVKYDGCWLEGKKHGYGVLYDRCGSVEFSGLFNDDSPFTLIADLRMDRDSILPFFHSHLESLVIADEFNSDFKSLPFRSELISLKRIDIGRWCCGSVTLLSVDSLPSLISIKVGEGSFNEGRGECLIMNCPLFRELDTEDESFNLYEVLELKNLPSLQSVSIGWRGFTEVRSFQLKGTFGKQMINQIFPLSRSCI